MAQAVPMTGDEWNTSASVTAATTTLRSAPILPVTVAGNVWMAVHDAVVV